MSAAKIIRWNTKELFKFDLTRKLDKSTRRPLGLLMARVRVIILLISSYILQHLLLTARRMDHTHTLLSLRDRSPAAYEYFIDKDYYLLPPPHHPHSEAALNNKFIIIILYVLTWSMVLSNVCKLWTAACSSLPRLMTPLLRLLYLFMWGRDVI